MHSRAALSALLVAIAIGCSAADGGDGAAGADGEDDFGNAPAQAGSAPAPPRSPTPASDAGLASDFTPTEAGGYKLGAELAAGPTAEPTAGAQSAQGCAMMTAVVRDFRGLKEDDGHPDFEAFSGRGPTTGLVAHELGDDGKPVYASACEAIDDRNRDTCPYGQQTTSRADFDRWYRSDSAVNRAYLLYLALTPSDGVHTFQSDAFFPLDDSGWGNGGGKRQHNFGFTTELHTQFLYRGGERFSFTGDDDLWVFIDGKLAIDLGGLHPPESEMIELDALADELGLTAGQTYALDLFHAERHSAASNFRLDTTIAFTDCGVLGPD